VAKQEIQNAIIESTGFKDIRETLDELAEQSDNLVFDYESEKGEKDARSWIAKLRRVNGTINKVHKVVKADVLERGRAIDSVKRDLLGRVAKMIEVHQEPLDAKANREKERIAKIDSEIDKIRKFIPNPMATYDVAQLDAMIERMGNLSMDEEVYQEKFAEAMKLYGEVRDRLKSMRNERVEIERQRAELEKIRKENEALQQGKKDEPVEEPESDLLGDIMGDLFGPVGEPVKLDPVVASEPTDRRSEAIDDLRREIMNAVALRKDILESVSVKLFEAIASDKIRNVFFDTQD
jgi:uncharacterized membrane protein